MIQPTQRKRFVVVGMARSGTTVTYQALQGHPEVRALMDEVRVSPFFTRGLEVFTVGGVNPYERDHGLDLLVDAMTLLPCAIANEHLMGYGGLPTVPKAATVRANGIKTAINGIEDGRQFVQAMLERPSLRDFLVIRVDRRDLVAQFASLMRAGRSGVWHSFYQVAPIEQDANAAFAIPPEEFERYCRECIDVRSELDRLGATHPVFEIDYERDVDGGDRSVYRRMFEFLSISPADPEWLSSSKVSPPVETYVTNALELYEIAARLQDERAA